MTIIFEPDDPLVVSGTYDQEGYTPKDRRAQLRKLKEDSMAFQNRKKKSKSKLKPKSKAPAKPVRKGPRSQPLPGMEQVRSKRLDNLCEGIADCRAQINSARQEETGLIVSALQTMVALALSTYRHATIELARIPGAEKLRVRVTKEDGDAGDGDLEVAEELTVDEADDAARRDA